MRRTLVAGLLVLAAACTATSEETTTTERAVTTTAAPTTTTAAPTTTTATTTTTTAPPVSGPYVVGTPTLGPPDPLPGGEGASGSGCAPGSDTLPDGIWFGYVVARDAASISFDLACMYFGDIANEKGAAAGEEVANDYFISNVNPALRTVPVEATVTFYEIDAAQPDVVLTPTFAEWPIDPEMYTACPSDWCGVWVYINDGAVTEVMEQYFP
jgi:hypothetical protein